MAQPEESTIGASELPEIIELSPDADITLVIKTEEGETTDRFYASSHILKHASQYFRAMFSDKFMEGVQLRSGTERPEIVVHEENPWGLSCILYAVHLKTASIPRQIAPVDLAQVAICCDKYGCVEAMGVWSDQWCEAREWNTSEEWGYALLAAWVLKPKSFKEIVRLAVLNVVPKSYGSVWKEIGVEDRLPCELLEHVRDVNARCRDKIQALIDNCCASLCDPSRNSCKGRIEMRCPKCQSTFGQMTRRICCDDIKLEPVPCTAEHRANIFLTVVEATKEYREFARLKTAFSLSIPSRTGAEDGYCSARVYCPLVCRLVRLSDSVKWLAQSVHGMEIDPLVEAEKKRLASVASGMGLIKK